jgi:uncharacterized metal-binding protein YceD (DUF177 family)
LNLGTISNGKNCFSFNIRDQFFEEFVFSDIKHVEISATVEIKKSTENLTLKLIIDGQINKLACDICTEEISMNISAETNMIIEKTDQEKESTDEILYIRANDNKIDLQKLIFELIVVNAPKKQQHPLDKNGNNTCNKEMIDLVKKYTQIKRKAYDPRWGALKNLKQTKHGTS